MNTRSNTVITGVAVLLIGIICLALTHTQPQLWGLWLAVFALKASATGLIAQRALRAQGRELARYLALSPELPSLQPALEGALEPAVIAAVKASQAVLDQQRAMLDSRHQLEALLEGMQDAVLGVDAAGRVQWSNAHMVRLMERGANGTAIRHGRALVHTFRDPAFLETVQRTLDERAVTECRSEALLPGRIFDVSAAPLPGGGAVVVMHDSTRAEQMERTQRDFVANVSHELRTPLTSIVGYVETVLDNETISPPAREFLETVLKNASRMHRLTEDLLLLSRIEQNENPLECAPVSAESLVRDALRTVSGTPYGEAATLTVSACTARSVMADENAVLQVLGNLLENAVKYSSGRAEAPRVIVSAEDYAPDPSFVVFRVQDFGPGIAQEHLTRVFERFYRVEKARSRATGGTGLGLSIARHLIEQQGGRIWIESTLGHGSTFLFTLPSAD